MFQILNELISPKFCIACNASGVDVCDQCLKTWRPVSLDRVVGVPSVAVAARAPQLIQAISVWKDHGVRSHSSIFARLLSQTVRTQNWFTDNFAVVAIPDKSTSLRRRGYSPMSDIQREFCRTAGLTHRAADVELRWARKVRDQRDLNSEQRFHNMKGAIEVRIDSKSPILVLDDVVTSGATMRAAVDALLAAGATRVVAAAIISSRSTRNWD